MDNNYTLKESDKNPMVLPPRNRITHNSQEEVICKIALEEFIKSCDFSWTVEKIMEERNKRDNGGYVSHTAKMCCEFYDNLKERL